jgi:hypothetical protein
VSRKIAGAQFAIGLLFLASFLFFAVRARFPIPYRDDWDWLGWLLTRPLTLRTLFEPHNEHMIPLPRLLVALQYGLEGSGTHFVFAIALAAQLALAWMFLREIGRRFPENPPMRRFALGVVAVCLFFTHQLQSFVFMAAVLFPLVQTFAVVAFVCALNATEPGLPGLKTRPTPDATEGGSGDGAGRAAWLAAAAAATACAGLTTTNGIVAPIIVALLIWVRRGSRTAAIAFALAGAAGLAAYVLLVGRPWVHAPAPAGAAWSVPPIGELVAFFLAFFASALAYGSVKAAVVVGSVLFALGCLSIWTVVRNRGSAPRIEMFSVAVMLFAMASAAMATPARAQFGAVQAAQSRYASYAMAYEAALFLWCLSRVSGSAWWRRREKAVTLSTVLASTVLLAAHVFIGEVWIAKAENVAFVRYALAARVNDDEWIATLHPVTSIVYETADRLRTDGDRQLIDPRLGEPWRQPAGFDACSGAIALQDLGEQRGWRAIGSLATPAATGVIVDRSLVVRGFAARAPLVETANPLHAQEVVDVVWRSFGSEPPSAPSWLGFAQKGDGGPYVFYGLATDGAPLCQSIVSTVPEPIRIYLDGPQGEVADKASGGGWAFQCDGSVERLRVFVDDVERAVTVVRGVSRPDVRTAFANRCEVAEGSGFSFQLNTRELPAGVHRVKVAADDSMGRTAESNTTEIVVRP